MKDNKVILITGTRKGIGRYLAEYYLEKNHFVIGCSRQHSDLVADRYRHFTLDVTNEKNVAQMFVTIRKRYGKLDALINNVGKANMNHSMLTPYTTVETVFKINTFGTFVLCREAAKLMSQKKYGRIVNFSSLAVPLCLEGEAVYAASKAAVNTLTRILAKELASFNITCNAIGPTPIKTDMLEQFPEEKIDKLLLDLAIKRFGKLTDVSNVIDFFISEQSDFITGQILYLGGCLILVDLNGVVISTRLVCIKIYKIR